MSGLTDEMRVQMRAIQANLSCTRRSSGGAKYLRYNAETGEPEWHEHPCPVAPRHSMFPYRSSAMAVDPSEVPEVQEQLRKEGLFVEFDSSGRPIIESTKQQDALAKALGMKTGRDGYGHVDEHGKFQNSGRRRAAEVAEGRGRVRRVIKKLEAMPEEVAPGVVAGVLQDYDIFPNEENTG